MGTQETFGKYQLAERIAYGGMAEVFLANVHGAAGFVKPVVIKRLHPWLNEDHDFVQMLIDEARITAQLTHGNICQVLDLGAVENSYYIAMEFISGEDAQAVQDACIRLNQPLPIPAAVYVISEVLAGLDYAHRKDGPDGVPLGIIHRDISPQNILISYEGEVKIIDFGIAKARLRLVQTRAGVIKGKFRYMAPEQACGEAIDHRADLFSAGVVLYELLSGGRHSPNLSDGEVLGKMRRAEFEPLKRARPDIPPELDEIVRRVLARRPRDRYGSAAEFRARLLEFLQGQKIGYGRSELATLMRQLFDQERRRRRSGEILSRVTELSLADVEMVSGAGTALRQGDPDTTIPFSRQDGASDDFGPNSPAEALDATVPSAGEVVYVVDTAPEKSGTTRTSTSKPATALHRQPTERVEASLHRQITELCANPDGAASSTPPGPGTGSSEVPMPRAGSRPALSPAAISGTEDTQVDVPQQTQRTRRRGVTGALVVVLLVAAVVVGTVLLTRLDGSPSPSPVPVVVYPPTSSVDHGKSHDARPQATAVLNVVSTPSGAAIRYCGQVTGLITPTTLTVEPARSCMLELELAEHENYRLEVTPTAGTSHIFATLRRKAGEKKPSTRRMGTLRVISIEEGTVYLDGRAVGSTPNLELQLAPGPYSVRVQFQSRRTKTRARIVNVKPDLTSVIDIAPQQQ